MLLSLVNCYFDTGDQLFILLLAKIVDELVICGNQGVGFVADIHEAGSIFSERDCGSVRVCYNHFGINFPKAVIG